MHPKVFIGLYFGRNLKLFYEKMRGKITPTIHKTMVKHGGQNGYVGGQLVITRNLLSSFFHHNLNFNWLAI